MFPAEEPPRGTRIIHLSQLEALLRHVRNCQRCKKDPKKANSFMSETRLGYGTVLRFHCGFTVATTPPVTVSSIVRDDNLFNIAQTQILDNATSLEALVAQYGHQEVSDAVAGGGAGGSGVPDVSSLGAADDGSFTVLGAAGSEHEDRRQAEVTTLSLQLALTHYLGGTDATRTMRTLFEFADIPSPALFKPSTKFAGLLVARAMLLVAFEGHRVHQPSAYPSAAGPADPAVLGTTGEDGTPLGTGDPLLIGSFAAAAAAAASHHVDETGEAPPAKTKYRGVYQFKDRTCWSLQVFACAYAACGELFLHPLHV